MTDLFWLSGCFYFFCLFCLIFAFPCSLALDGQKLEDKSGDRLVLLWEVDGG